MKNRTTLQLKFIFIILLLFKLNESCFTQTQKEVYKIISIRGIVLFESTKKELEPGDLVNIDEKLILISSDMEILVFNQQGGQRKLEKVKPGEKKGRSVIFTLDDIFKASDYLFKNFPVEKLNADSINALRVSHHFVSRAGGGFGLYDGSIKNGKSKFIDLHNTFWNGNAMLGYRFIKDSLISKNTVMLALFGKYGSLSRKSVSKMILEQEEPIPSGNQGFNPFWEVEIGFLLREWFSVSSGIGQQKYKNLSNKSFKLNYYSSSIGVLLKYDIFDLNVSGTILFGRDYKNFTLRAGASINVWFEFL